MIVKLTRYFWIILLSLLTACGHSSQTNAPDIQNTAVAMARTGVVLTLTALPTVTLPPPIFTQTALPTSLPPATPTQVPPTIPILTPDATQVERWQEYQTELAKVILSSNPELGHDPAIFKDALCEWDILGQSSQEVYIYVVCALAEGNGDARKPAIIYLEPDGSIRKVKLPEPKGADSLMYDYDPFPIDVQEKFCYYFDPFPSDLPLCPYSGTYSRPRLDILHRHIEYRKAYPEEPPLVVLSAIPTSLPPATATPTQPVVSILTPDAIQVETWKEYQTELAKSIFPNDPPELFLCEWDILGRSSQEVYVWAVCGVGERSGSAPTVIHLNPDGSILNTEIPWDWSVENIHKMFPEDVRNKFDYMYAGEIQKMSEHLEWRWAHIGEPPLIILSATPAP